MLLQITPTNNPFAAAGGLITEVQQKLVDYGTQYGVQAVGAVIILVIGLFFATWLGRLLSRWLERHKLEPPVRMLIVRIVRLIVMLFVVVMVLDKFGVPVTTLIAGISVVGVGAGLAMQGVLGNLVAGLTIIFTRPFRIGEYVEISSVYGQVQTIELFSTTLLHSDMSKVVIPNRKIVGEILHNYGNIRQLNLSVGVAYASDLPEVLTIVQEIVDNNPRVLKTPPPVIGIAELAGSSITISVKPWTAVPDFNPARAEIYQAIIAQFRSRKIEIPFPQQDVRLLNNP